MEKEELYASCKPLLFSLAYRMLGSVADAEDAVQEAFVKLEEAPVGEIRNLRAYLCRIVVNSCIDRLRSAQKKREVYHGQWLPEPVVSGDREEDPLARVMRKESISTAYLFLLEQLSWTERAVFLLREALGYDYGEIAEIVGKTPVNCRQIFRRARQSLGHPEERPNPVPEQARRLVEQFAEALSAGNVPRLLNLLAADAVLVSDGGGKVRSALRPILGAQRITAFFAGILPKVPPGVTWQIREVNGLPGIVVRVDVRVMGVFSFDFEGERIRAVYWVVNPDKLRHVT
jgi:RNA polymerase sigma-70 factor (TIGR02957 family)